MNTYKIEFLKTHAFRTENDTVNFKIYDSDDVPVTGLESDLSAIGSASTTFTIAAEVNPDHLDEYVLTIGSFSEYPLSMNETVKIQYNSEDISEEINTLTLLIYLEHFRLIGGATFSFDISPHSVAFTDSSDTDKLVVDGNSLTGLGDYPDTPTCTGTWTYGESLSLAKTMTVSINPPIMSSPTADDVTINSATITTDIAVYKPEDATVKFRYGISSSFDPDDSETYSEVDAVFLKTENFSQYFSADVTGLDDNTTYAMQAVYVAYGRDYVDKTSSFNTFTTLNIPEIHFDKELLILMDDGSNGTFKVTPDETPQGSYSYLWEALNSGVTLENATTNTVKVISVASPTDMNVVQVKCTVNDMVDGEAVATYTGIVLVHVYKTGTIQLYVDTTDSRVTSTILYINPLLSLTSITPGIGSGTVFSYNSDTKEATAIAKGTGAIAIVYEDPKEATHNVSISVTVSDHFVAPTYDEIVEKVIIKYSEEQVFTSYQGYQYKKLNVGSESLPVVYCIKTNGKAFNWVYDIVAVNSDLVKFGLDNITP